jgi:hypothetical protein
MADKTRKRAEEREDGMAKYLPIWVIVVMSLAVAVLSCQFKPKDAATTTPAAKSSGEADKANNPKDAAPKG